MARDQHQGRKRRSLDAGFVDQAYLDAGAQLATADTPAQADLVLCVQSPDSAAIGQLKQGATLVGMLQPQADPARAEALKARGILAFPLEKLPRTTRAQSMDVLSSQAGMAGYKAMLIAAQLAPRLFPMLTTAAGTIRPSRVLVIGAGVAGLQAIATARRLGAQVEGFDVRPETREQIRIAGRQVPRPGVSPAGEGGYARHSRRGTRRAANAGSPIIERHRRGGLHRGGAGSSRTEIITMAMVEAMKPGSVIVDRRRKPAAIAKQRGPVKPSSTTASPSPVREPGQHGRAPRQRNVFAQRFI